MTVAKTAAAIGITVAANTAQAGKSITTLNQQVGGLVKTAKTSSALGFVGSTAMDGLEQATRGLGRAAVATTKWGIGLGALGIAAAAIGLGKLATDLGTTGAAAGRSADRLGLPVERLSQFQIAARLAGSSADDMTGSLASLQATVADAAYNRNPAAWSAFRAAGIDVGNARDGARDYAAMLPRIADETKRLASVNRNAALRFLDLVGVSRDLFPLLRNGSAGLQGYLNQAQHFGPMTQDQATKARELEMVMTQLGLRFEEFERIGGAAIAPGLTKFLDTLQHYLQDHKEDVTEFFSEIEQGIEWLTTPKNLAWLREELDKFAGEVKELLSFLLQLEHNPLIRRLLGLPPEGPTAGEASTAPIMHGVPGEDDGGRLEHALDQSIRNDARNPRGTGPFNNPQSLLYNAHPGGDTGKLLPQLQSLSDSMASAAGVPQDFARAIFGLEHGLNPDGSPRRSPAGAIGAGQLMPDTAAGLGVDPRILSDNVRGSIEYMRQMLDTFHGNQAAAAAAYNAGPNGRGVAYFARTGDPSQLPLETQHYVQHWMSDPGAQRFTTDAANPGAPPDASSYASPLGAGDGRMGKLQIELRHVNPPPGAEMTVTSADPSQVEVTGPRVMGAMPGSGQQRNVAREGY